MSEDEKAIEWEAYGAIAEAARIFELLSPKADESVSFMAWGDIDAWLESDVVVRARAHVANRPKEG